MSKRLLVLLVLLVFSLSNIPVYADDVMEFDTVWSSSSGVNNGYPYLQALIPADTTSVTDFSLNKTSTTLTVGGTETLTATVAPSNATNKNVTWTSSNPNAATVSASDGGKTAMTVKQKAIDSDAPKVSISQARSVDENIVAVDVNLENNTGFVSLGIEVGYNSQYFTLTGLQNESAVGGNFATVQTLTKNPINLSWYSASDITYNGKIATLTFEVSKEAPEGTYPVTVDFYKGVDGNYIDGEDVNFDEDFNSLNLTYINGRISVNEKDRIVINELSAQGRIEMTVSVVGNKRGFLVAAVYDGSGEMTGAKMVPVQDENEYHFDLPGGSIVKVFWLNDGLSPVAEPFVKTI